MGMIISRKKKIQAIKRYPQNDSPEHIRIADDTVDDERPPTPPSEDEEENQYEVPIDSGRRSDDDQDDDDDEEEEEEREDSENEEEQEEQEEEAEEEEEEQTKNEEAVDKDDDDEDDKEEKVYREEKMDYPASELPTHILNGDLNIEIPSQVRIVRIFTSSTFTDTFHERNTLMKKVYPKLKEYCQSVGFDFQVVDMRWGVRDEATADHMTSELCMRELEACQRLSTGPNFITFLGQKYGYRPFPPKIIAQELEAMINVISDVTDKELVSKWFLKDDNVVPPTYVLQPINELLPNYNNQLVSKEERSKASNEWWTAFERMQVVLRQAALKAFEGDKESIWKYFMSVTEDEITRGILNAKDPRKHTYWFKRNITDIKDYVADKHNTRNFIDKQGKELDTEANDFCKQLCDEKIPAVLQSGEISVYDVRWNGDSGIEPESCKQHNSYLEVLCKDFYRQLTKMIDGGIEERKLSDVDDSLIKEICQHATTCIEKSRIFRGRKDTLKQISEYLVEEYDDEEDYKPLVVHGASGCGKTSIMAKAAFQAKLKHKDCVQVTRFLGTTSDSSTISKVLYSVICQMKRAKAASTELVPKTTKLLTSYLENMFDDMRWDASQKYIWFLDSIDQLSPDDGAHFMRWLPKKLPKNVKIVISTLPDQKYMILPTLKGALPDRSLIEVPQLPQNIATKILTAWLDDQSRKLPESQMKTILSAFDQCPLPLFLKLCFDEALRWKSYTHSKDTILQINIKDAINTLFERLERLHGKELVSHALGMITASKHGLSDAELDDILSIDDDVLNDVYQYWTPPVRRIPPLLWVRIRTDLGSYIVSRGANGSLVNMWYHRQFIETATERYLSEEAKSKYHVILSEYFLGLWSNGKPKPYVNKSNESGEEDRLVAMQPNVFLTQNGSSSGVFNYRKLSELPYHLCLSNNLKAMKDKVLFNFDFLLAKLQAFGYQQLIEDFDLAATTFSSDKDVKFIHEFLKMSSSVLLHTPNQLPAQIVGRLLDIKSDSIQQLIKAAKTCNVPCLYPNMRCYDAPGGPILHTLAGHTQSVNYACATRDKKGVLSVANDTSLRIWDLSNGREVRSIDCDDTLTAICPILDNETAIATSYSSIMSMNLVTQEIYYKDYHSSGYGETSGLTTDEKYYVISNDEGIEIFDCQQKEIKPIGKIEHKSDKKAEMSNFLKVGKDCYAYTRGLKSVFYVRNIDDSPDKSAKKIKTPNEIIFFSFNEDGSKFLVLCCTSKLMEPYKKVNLHVYDTATWKVATTWKTKTHHTVTYCTDASVCGNELIWPTIMQINFWNFETGQERIALKQGYQGAQYKQAFCIDENTMVVVSMSQSNHSMPVYNLEAVELDIIGDEHQNRTEIELARAYVGEGERELSIHPDLNIGMSMPVMDPLIRVWDTSTFQLLRTFKMQDVHPTAIKIVDEKFALLWEHNKKTVLTLDYEQGRIVAALPQGSTCDYPPSAYYHTWVLLKQSNELLLFDADRKYFKTYDWRTGRETGKINTGFKEKSQQILSNHDGSIIMAAEHYDDFTKVPPMLIFDTVKRTEIGRIQTEERIDVQPGKCFITKDSRYFVFIHPNLQKIAIFDIKTAGLVKEIGYKKGEYEVGTAYACATSDQQNCLIVNFSVPLNENGTYRQTNFLVFYELETWEHLTERRVPSMVTRFDFSSDGNRLMTFTHAVADGSSRSMDIYDLKKLKSDKVVDIVGSFVPENDVRFCYLTSDGNSLGVGLANIGAVTFFKGCNAENKVENDEKLDKTPAILDVECPFYPNKK